MLLSLLCCFTVSPHYSGCTGHAHLSLGQIKKISVFGVMGLKILGRVCTHIFLIIYFSGK